MEAMRLPLREIRKRFTRSELVLMAWRSGEIASNMWEGQKERAQARPNAWNEGLTDALVDPALAALEARLGPQVVERMVDEHGEIDLRRLTGDQALRYMNAMGFPLMPGMSRRTGPQDDISRTVARAYGKGAWEGRTNA